MSKPVLLIGMGGHSKVVRDIIESSTDYHLAGYLDDVINDYYEEDGLIYDNLKDINRLKSQYYFVLAIGNNTVREKYLIKMIFRLNVSQFYSPVINN